MKQNVKALTIAGHIIKPGECKEIELPAPCLYTQTPANIPIHVIHGKEQGPCVFLMAAVHGDEINGVEIIRLLLKHYSLKKLRGTLIAIPVANVYGFITLSRYLPDRRDLNRSFPGSKTGSLTARLAHLLMEEVLNHCTHGIDLHTGSTHIDNVPQIRTNIDTPGALAMARAFNAPIILDAKLRDGSLRQAAAEKNIPVLVYEGGEALRFSELAIQVGLRGVLKVLNALKMIQFKKITKSKKIRSKLVRYSGWVRSEGSGIVHPLKALGSQVKKGEMLGVIADPFSKKESIIKSPCEGIIIGRNSLPLVNEGDALFHIAQSKGSAAIRSELNKLHSNLIDNPLIFF